MPPTSLSQTPFFQHLLSSLPSLRAQIKDAVTASMKQWLLEIRNTSTEVGRLAVESMEQRTKRWRSRRDKDVLLRSNRVGSAVELITYEKIECKSSHSSARYQLNLTRPSQLTSWITTSSMSISNRSSNASLSILLSTR